MYQIKIDFGSDFLQLMRELQNRASIEGGIDKISDAAASLFLTEWGLTVDEINEANKQYWEKWERNELKRPADVYQSMVDFAQHSLPDRHRLITHIAAIVYLDFEVTEEEREFTDLVQELFDMRPSEFNPLLEKGRNLAVALNHFGNVYAQAVIDEHEKTSRRRFKKLETEEEEAARKDDPNRPKRFNTGWLRKLTGAELGEEES